MSAFIINNIPVYLTHEKYIEISKKACKDKDWEFMVSATMQGTEEGKEKRKLIFDELWNLYRNDKEKFISDWSEFELTDKEAEENIYSLLDAYCAYHGYAYLSESRCDMQQIIDSYTFDYKYPIGKIFSLNHNVKPEHWWWKYSNKMKGRVIRIVIDTRKVKKVIGNLKYFQLYTENFILLCGKDLEILPLN
nr:hypothetical protein [Sedimentibacter sp.]